MSKIRRRLRDYFARKNCRPADDLADETLTRVARRLEEEGITLTETPARYCYIVARFVFLEHLREANAHRVVSHPSTDVAPQAPASSAADAEEAGTREKFLASLENLSRGPHFAESPHHHAASHRRRARED